MKRSLDETHKCLSRSEMSKFMWTDGKGSATWQFQKSATKVGARLPLWWHFGINNKPKKVLNQLIDTWWRLYHVSHTNTHFWSRKTSVIIKTFQLNFHVFMCLSSRDFFIFSVRVFSFFSCFCVKRSFVLQFRELLSSARVWNIEVFMKIFCKSKQSWHK